MPSRPMPIRGVLFDIDDTLVDTRSAFAAALAAVARLHLPDLPPERHGELLAMWRRDVGGHYRAYTRGEVGVHTQRLHRANELHAAFGGAQLDDAGYREWWALFSRTFVDGSRAHDDAPGLLDLLDDAGVAYGALSNAGVALQTDKLARARLARVRMLVGVDTLGVGKPDPRVFAEACRRLGTAPGETLYVGDELDVDAQAAVDAGLRGVWLDRPGSRRGGACVEDDEAARAAGVSVITSLAELAALL